ncbi:MAG: hypothetical protein ACTHMC_09705 [Pseudobacter sp.]|uniref:hypothetical protein n=1 Tax=Pseudobacter sp. TaxID=2045420 RepID=UPI003F7D989C
MQDLKNFGLTVKDFDLLIDGLETLPEKGVAGEMMGMMLEGLISKDDPVAQEKVKRDRERQLKDKEHARNMMREDIRILQGKLYQLKRFMQENNLLEEVNKILSGNA